MYVFIIATVIVASVPLQVSAQSISPQPTTIGFIGDSITYGNNWSANQTDANKNAVDIEIELLGSGYKGINRGAGGSKAYDWQPDDNNLISALAAFEANNVTIVSIMLGTNDADDGQTNEQYKANMQTLITTLLNTGYIKHVIVNYPFLINSKANRERVVGYEQPINELINNETIFLGATGAQEYFLAHPEEVPDKVHPDLLGYSHLGAMWHAAYKKVFIDPLANELALTTINGAPFTNTIPDLTNTAVLEGTGKPGTSVVITLRSDPITCTAEVGVLGTWTCTLSGIVPGAHTLSLQDTLGSMLPVYAVRNGNGSTQGATPDTPVAVGVPNTGIVKVESAGVFVFALGIISVVALLYKRRKA